VSKPTPVQLALRDEYWEMLDQARLNGWAARLKCHESPGLFTDNRSAVSAQDAEVLCAGCPMLELCRPYAEAFPPVWGVLGGISWEDKHAVQKIPA
jgi:hypothetical protein